jgi:hypothetical protein
MRQLSEGSLGIHLYTYYNIYIYICRYTWVLMRQLSEGSLGIHLYNYYTYYNIYIYMQVYLGADATAERGLLRYTSIYLL